MRAYLSINRFPTRWRAVCVWPVPGHIPRFHGRVPACVLRRGFIFSFPCPRPRRLTNARVRACRSLRQTRTRHSILQYLPAIIAIIFALALLVLSSASVVYPYVVPDPIVRYPAAPRNGMLSAVRCSQNSLPRNLFPTTCRCYATGPKREIVKSWRYLVAT
jgi:hypothetical protein